MSIFGGQQSGGIEPIAIGCSLLCGIRRGGFPEGQDLGENPTGQQNEAEQDAESESKVALREDVGDEEGT